MLLLLFKLGMMPGLLDTFAKAAEKKGLVWSETLEHWKDNNQWHVEVY